MRAMLILFAVVTACLTLAIGGFLVLIVLPASIFISNGQWYYALPWLVIGTSAFISAIIGTALHVSTK